MKHFLLKAGAIVSIITLAFLMLYAIIITTATDHSPVTTSIAVDKPTAPREVKEIMTDSTGNLIITYSDGTVQNAGKVKGEQGDGQYPTQAQLSAALLEYCGDGRCDAKAPSQEAIIQSLELYCRDGFCKGSDGKNALPITAEQIAHSVASYCADGRCRGTPGVNGTDGINGAIGAAGDTTIISCVTHSATPSAKYIAWKYTKELDSSYRDLYKLPVWAEASNCKTI